MSLIIIIVVVIPTFPSFVLPQLRISVSGFFYLASGDKIITLTVGTVPNQDLERFLRECRGVIINIADAENPLTLDDVRRNGFEDEDNRNTGPGFVQTFWTNMVDKLDVESADNDVCCRLTWSCLSSPNPLQARHFQVT